jgi:hypothetical protein
MNKDNNMQNTIEDRLNVIQYFLNEKKIRLSKNRYNSVPVIKVQDEELVTHLEATYDLLKIMNERLNILENSQNKS